MTENLSTYNMTNPRVRISCIFKEETTAIPQEMTVEIDEPNVSIGDVLSILDYLARVPIGALPPATAHVPDYPPTP